MSSKRKQLKLAAVLMAPAASSGGWRHPLAQSVPADPLAYYARLARKAEAGKLDYLFQADQYRISATTPQEIRHGVNVGLEPMMLLSALASVTSRIGLSSTLSTTYAEPYHVARMFATLDHLSGGRASWNIVTSIGDREAANFKNDHRPPQERRHEHSHQFVEVVKALWDSWEDDAIVQDKATGVFADPDKVHRLDHESEWFAVRGPLNVARPPQGHPVLIQAGQSESFQERAAQSADVIFTMLGDLPQAQQFYRSTKSRLGKYGRTPDDLLIMPGLNVWVGATEAEARDKQQYYRELHRPETRMDMVSYLLGIPVDDRKLDDPLPEVNEDDPQQRKYKEHKQLADRHGWTTIRQLYEHLSKGNKHFSLTGTPGQIAGQLERWLDEKGADGFTFIPHMLPAALDDLLDLVVPELQDRQLLRSDYEGRTLREHLGLRRPANRYAGRESGRLI